MKHTANKFAVLDRENEISKQNDRIRFKKSSRFSTPSTDNNCNVFQII